MGAFKEIGRVQTGKDTNIVVSRTGEEKIVLAKSMTYKDEDGRDRSFYYKHALTLNDMSKVKELRNILNDIIASSEK